MAQSWVLLPEVGDVYALILLSATLMGAAFGSFLNVAILRIPAGASLWSPPSHCPVCESSIAWYDNVPVLSWLVLRGRCRTCDAPIPAFHVVIETLVALVAWLIVHRFIRTEAEIDPPHLAAATLYFGFVWCLLLAAFVDLRTRIIPEHASLYALPVGLAGAAVLDALGYHGWLHIGWRMSFLGALAGGGLLGGLSLTWRYVLGREGLGWGDVRLAAMIGAFLGPVPGLWSVLLIGSVLGALAGIGTLLMRQRSSYLPFGPSLAAGAVIYLFWGDHLIRRFLPGLRDLL